LSCSMDKLQECQCFCWLKWRKKRDRRRPPLPEES